MSKTILFIVSVISHSESLRLVIAAAGGRAWSTSRTSDRGEFRGCRSDLDELLHSVGRSTRDRREILPE